MDARISEVGPPPRAKPADRGGGRDICRTTAGPQNEDESSSGRDRACRVRRARHGNHRPRNAATTEIPRHAMPGTRPAPPSNSGWCAARRCARFQGNPENHVRVIHSMLRQAKQFRTRAQGKHPEFAPNARKSHKKHYTEWKQSSARLGIDDLPPPTTLPPVTRFQTDDLRLAGHVHGFQVLGAYRSNNVT